MEKRFSQSELEAIAQALADTSEGLTGSEIGHLLTTLKMADPTPTMTKWKRQERPQGAKGTSSACAGDNHTSRLE